MTYLPITVQIRQEQLLDFYRVLHLGTAHGFNTLFSNKGKPMESPEGNATTTKEKTVERPQEKSRTFYGKVTKECTCGKCYSKLARYDRMPWSWDGKCATNSLGDRYVPKSCGMTKNVAPCMGYIQHPKPSAHDLLIAKSSAVAHTTTGRLELDKRKVAASEKLVES